MAGAAMISRMPIREMAEIQPVEVDRPKLLIAARVFGASGQPWLWRQAVGLSGFRTEVVCWNRQNAASQPLVGTSVRVLATDPAPYDGAGRWLYRLRNLPRLNFYAAIGDEERQLVHLIRQDPPAALLCNLGDIALRLVSVARQQRVPVVAYIHDEFSFLTNRWYLWSLCKCLPQFAAIIVVTHAQRTWMIEQGVPEHKVHVIPCGAPVDVFRPSIRKSGRAIRFVMVSRLVTQKGCDITIKAFASIAEDLPDTELHIYGDGPEKENLHQLVETLGLASRVSFHGYVEEQRLAETLPQHDVFLQHSLNMEGSPVSLAEAMACGLPMIATPVGGIKDQVLDRKTGLLVAEGDMHDMAAAMRELASDPELRRRLGRASRERAIAFYDSSLLTQQLNRVLHAVAMEPMGRQ
jgi:glycosyltransferase involved in cell wall biosynthesis